MPISFTGLNSVMDRVLFTRRGPIVKKPLDMLAGSDLRIVSATEVEIPSSILGQAREGFVLYVSGTPGGRNDGSFEIDRILSVSRAVLRGASLDVSDGVATLSRVVDLVNATAFAYNLHRSEGGVHGTDDTVNVVSAPPATDLPSVLTLLADLRSALAAHLVDVSGDPGVHDFADSSNALFLPVPETVQGALLLANEIRKSFEAHRLNPFVHVGQDAMNRVMVQPARVVKGVFPGSMTGPFQWIIRNPRFGQIADDPTDVAVTVNGSPASVEAVVGLLGAVVLTQRPDPGDSVLIDYSFLNNPPTSMFRTNSPEFVLNQVGLGGYSGLPGHKYKARSFLPDPSRMRVVGSPVSPRLVKWKYKGLERAYTASLNDPNLLLTNTPAGKHLYPVLYKEVPETTVTYDPSSLPDAPPGRWVAMGEGTATVANGSLRLVDGDPNTGTGSNPPFYSVPLEIEAPEVVSAAFRLRVVESSDDGAFTGVALGVSDGRKMALVGMILTEATSLSSGITLANRLKEAMAGHASAAPVHVPSDPGGVPGVVEASNSQSLVILANDLRSKYEAHRQKGGVDGVHGDADSVNAVTAPEADSLETALDLLNAVRNAYNMHLSEPGVHFQDDSNRVVGKVRQAGILTSGGFPEFQESWRAGWVEWNDFTTLRMLRDENGSVSLYISGGVDPIASVSFSDLPSLTDFDAKFEPVQQAFFGAMAREATSTSEWQFIRLNATPVDSRLIEGNKRVEYEATTVPELDTDAPWVNIGESGSERTTSGVLVTDSTASATPGDSEALGSASGAFRGYLRLEPGLSQSSTCSAEFRVSADLWTHGVDNRSLAVVLDDGTFSTQVAFLQFSPSPATVRGSVSEPFSVLANDLLSMKLDGVQYSVLFQNTDTTAALAAARVNSAVGQTVAVPAAGSLQVSSPTVGRTSRVEITGGSALARFGISPGQYFGLDSTAEPKVSWYGENFPDRTSPTWSRSGGQASEMLSRTMRTVDSSTDDYVLFVQSDPVVTNRAVEASVDWKMDFRMRVLSFQEGDGVPASGPHQVLFFCGCMASVDEGPSGKSLELHLAVDSDGDPFLNLLSYDPGTGELIVQAQYAFDWRDGGTHSLSVLTSKGADAIFVAADGTQLVQAAGPAPTYSGLFVGSSGPTVMFGTGGEPVTGTDMRSARSVIDWESFAIIRDSRMSDPAAASNRYVGIYKGGPESELGSYYLHQVDWAQPHTYKVVRDPTTSVAVYVDGSSMPAISASYDILSLPPSRSSFLARVTGRRPCVAFGAFSPYEISRSRWDFFRYSMGKLTLTDRIVPPHQVLSQMNVMASPEHLRTIVEHEHLGALTWSGGTPRDEFLERGDVEAATQLGEGTAPVPMTQDLDSRGGLLRVHTTMDNVAAEDVADVRGYLTDLEDDKTNVLEEPSVVEAIAAVANDLRSLYEAHRASLDFHQSADVANVVTAPAATSLAGAITLLNDVKARFNGHVFEAGVHFLDDSFNPVTSPDATDADTAVTLATELRGAWEAHRVLATPHVATDAGAVSEADASDLPTLLALLEGLGGIRVRLNSHFPSTSWHALGLHADDMTAPMATSAQTAVVAVNQAKVALNAHLSRGLVHRHPDLSNQVAVADATGTPSAIVLANAVKAAFNAHLGQQYAHSSPSGAAATAPAPSDPEKSSVKLSNQLLRAYMAHLVQGRVHVADDLQNLVTVGEAGDEASAIPLANAIKAALNAHLSAVVRESQQVHTRNDSVNSVAAADATDLGSLITLLHELRGAYESHREQPGVHGSSMFIRLDPPSRVLYEAMKFVRTEEGEENLLAPFSDQVSGVMTNTGTGDVTIINI